MTDITALMIATVCLYSTGHWIGATVSLVWLGIGLVIDANDPTGLKRLRARFS
jgi:hypothetical protein